MVLANNRDADIARLFKRNNNSEKYGQFSFHDNTSLRPTAEELVVINYINLYAIRQTCSNGAILRDHTEATPRDHTEALDRFNLINYYLKQ